jgi:hypothetical protein
MLYIFVSFHFDHKYGSNNYKNIALDCRRSMIKSPKQNMEEDVLTKHREEYTRVWKRKKEELKKE